MKISAKAEYACLAILELAHRGPDGVPLRIREIAEAQGIPERYLVQILLQLKAAGMVRSTRGSVGGYLLARRSEDISVADIVSAIEGKGEPPRKSHSPAARALTHILEQARAAERRILAGTTIAQLAGRISPHDWVL